MNYNQIFSNLISIKKIKKDKHINDTIFNVGFENLSILDIAQRINKSLKLKSKIFIEPSNDPRSYRQNSEKIFRY